MLGLAGLHSDFLLCPFPFAQSHYGVGAGSHGVHVVQDSHICQAYSQSQVVQCTGARASMWLAGTLYPPSATRPARRASSPPNVDPWPGLLGPNPRIGLVVLMLSFVRIGVDEIGVSGRGTGQQLENGFEGVGPRLRRHIKQLPCAQPCGPRVAQYLICSETERRMGWAIAIR